VLALPLGFGEARFVAFLRVVAPGRARFAAFFLPAFRLELFVDFFAELLVFRFTFALPRAAAFFRVVAFFFTAIARLVLLIRFHLPTEIAGEDGARAIASSIGVRWRKEHLPQTLLFFQMGSDCHAVLEKLRNLIICEN
jgi:hypothetical protein